MVYRVETGRLDRAERAAAGGLRVPAAIGRSGTLEYMRADGTRRVEYRPPEEAFSPDSLASLRGAPVTDLHPPEPVTPETYRTLARGHVGDDARPDADGEHVAASLYVHDADLIRAIEAGERHEVSAGYHADLDETPGVAPDGTPYDAVQRSVRYNHVAVGPRGWGRAGPSVALRLDGDLNATEPGDAGMEARRMKTTIRIAGVNYTVDADETAAQAIPAALEKEREEVERLRADLAAAEEHLKDSEKAIRDSEAEVEEEKGRADALAERLKAETDPAALAARVAARVALEGRARLLRRDLVCDGLSDVEVMARALGVERTDAMAEDYLRGRFEALAERMDGSTVSLAVARAVASATGGETLSPAETARRRYISRNGGN